ncbi:MAG: MlaD family protein [Steroidobacteraceae bacterium]
MASTSTRLAWVGLFVLVGVALVGATIVWFGRYNPLAHSSQAEVVFAGNANGIGVGAPVVFGGIPVGDVSAVTVEYDPQRHQTYVPVKLQLETGKVLLPQGGTWTDPNIRQLVAQGLRARLTSVSLISGQTQIYLSFDPASTATLHPRIARWPEIPVDGSVSGPLAQELSELPMRKLAINAILAVQSVRRLSDSLSATLPAFIASATRSSDKMGQTLDLTRAAVRQLQAQLTVTLGGIDRLTGSAQQQLNSSGSQLHSLLQSSSQTVSDAHEVLGNLKAMTGKDAPDRVNLDEALSNMSAASAALRGFAYDVEENPTLLLTGRRP